MASEQVILQEWRPALPNPPNTATPEIQETVNKLKSQIAEKLKLELGACQALFYNGHYLYGGTDYLILVSKSLITAYTEQFY